ncbi:MAG TPA: GNAT family N-acetyltransferase [Streptosporangiaceae bacterium]|nr:GNAT family N-acetyltransferase [Streptosporangiaceae bacterium]
MSITDIIISVILRAATPGDLAPVQAICAQVLDRDPEAAQLPAIMAAAPGRLCVVAEAASEVTGVCYGSLRTRAGRPVLGYVDLLAVAQSAAGRGIGRALLAAMEQLLTQHGADELIIGGHPPVYLWPGVDVHYTVMTCLASRTGYTRYADATDMVVDLSTADLRGEHELARLAAAGIVLRRAARAESFDLMSWLRAGPWRESTWPDEVARTLDREPAACHVACRDGQYLGFACHGSVRAGWFGPMGTLSAERGRGIGAALLRRCLADMRSAGEQTAMIGWVGPVRFYARAVGARIDRVYWLYRKRRGE